MVHLGSFYNHVSICDFDPSIGERTPGNVMLFIKFKCSSVLRYVL